MRSVCSEIFILAIIVMIVVVLLWIHSDISVSVEDVPILRSCSYYSFAFF